MYIYDTRIFIRYIIIYITWEQPGVFHGKRDFLE